MARTYYPQVETPEPTLTVGELRARLADYPDDTRVVFQSPKYGAFGSDTMYSIDEVAAVSLEGHVEHYEGGVRHDYETGEPEDYPPHDHVSRAWQGVVIG